MHRENLRDFLNSKIAILNISFLPAKNAQADGKILLSIIFINWAKNPKGMADSKSISANTAQKGMSTVLDGVACKVVDVEISKPGKHGHSKVRLSAVGLIDDKKRIVVMPGHDSIEVPIIEKRSAQVLSVQGDTANVMDSETYETFDLKIPDELKGQVVDGSSVLYWDIMGNRVIKQLKSTE